VKNENVHLKAFKKDKMGKSRSNIFSRRRKVDENDAKEVSVDKGDKKRRSNATSSEHVSLTAIDNSSGSKVDKKKEMKSSAKQKSENNRSLRRMKKRGVVRQMFEKIPKEVRLGGATSKSNKTSKETVEVESEYDIPSELYPGPTVSPLSQLVNNDDVVNSDDNNDDPEDIYESRKLLIRQMQGLIAKEVHGTRSAKEPVCSEYDSWSDLEENFALAYEPIPLNINMDTWRKMSKKDILKTVRSKKMKKEFEYMSRSEILGKIEMMQKSAQYLSTKFGVDHLLPKLSASDTDLSRKPSKPVKTRKVRAQVHHNHPVPLTDFNGNNRRHPPPPDDNASIVTDFSAEVPAYVSRTEILKFYSKEQHQPKQSPPLPPPSKNVQNQKQPKFNKNEKIQPEFIPPPPPVIQKRLPSSKKSQNFVRIHDSWSSRASSIMNNPESIYVSRHELLQQINNGSQAKFPPKYSAGSRIHDSWSSRASSILAKAEEEPPYMSRTEMLEKIAIFNLGGKIQAGNGGRSSSTSGENDDNDDNESNASTVKNVVLVKKTELQIEHPLQEETSRRLDKLAKEKRKNVVKEKEVNKNNDDDDHDHHPEILSNFEMSGDEACSCDSCNTYSDCSCCDHSNETGSDSSAETVVNGGHLSSDGEGKGNLFHFILFIILNFFGMKSFYH